MSTDNRGLPESVRLPFDNAASHTITAFFKHASLLNVAQSEEHGKAIYDLHEVVELRFAGDRNYAPVLPAESMWRKEGNRVITYAERFSDQYRQFLMGDDQKAGGTALEMLQDYGITPAQLSICRALKIYSIEALHAIGPNEVKSLGMSANELKKMARRYVEDHTKRSIESTNTEVDKLKAELERLKGLIPSEQASPAEIDALVAAADKEFEDMTSDELKDFIAEKTGDGRPRGNPSHDTLVSMAKELAA